MIKNTELLDEIIIGYTPHKIYAFSTPQLEKYLKVGETSRSVKVRLDEWKKKISDLQLENEWLAMVPKSAEEQKEFFQDFALHQYFQNKGYMPMNPSKAPGNSKEFYPVNEDIINEGIDAINQDYLSEPPHQYNYLSIENNARIIEHWKRDKNFKLRNNQKRVLDNIVRVAHDNSVPRNYLLFAVMRFGKTFVSLEAAKKLDSKLTVIVSAKADVKNEWKQNLESHLDFEGYIFLDSDSLKNSSDAIQNELDNHKRVVIFLTLQDLNGKKIKEKHKELFGKTIDLLIIDESHFGARAQSYGQVIHKIDSKGQLKTYDAYDIRNLDDREGKEEVKALDNIKQLNRQYTLHLSGTPYKILMGNEFSNPKQVVGKIQFEDILAEKEKWYETHLDEPEWKNDYFGFPQMIRFGFNLNDSAIQKIKYLEKMGNKSNLNEIFGPLSNKKNDENHKKFKHEEYVLGTLKALDGSEKSDCVFPVLDYEKIKEGNMAHHIVMVLPYKASCDAMGELLLQHQSEFYNFKDYEIINIAGHDAPLNQKVKEKISAFSMEGRKTISLTVNKMLTGVTVPQWDTMVFFKDTQSPQEYDQAIYRLQSPYVTEQVNEEGKIINKEDMKPQTLLIDFAPNRMMSIEQYKAFIYSASDGEVGNDRVENYLERQMKSSPIITINNEFLTKIKPNDVLKYVAAYSSEKGIIEQANEISVDLSILNSDLIRSVIENENELGGKTGLKFKRNESSDRTANDDDVNTGDENEIDESEADNNENASSHENSQEATEEVKLQKKIQNYYLRILFYSFLSPETDINNLNDIVESYGNNERLAKNLGLEQNVLEELLHTLKNPYVRKDLDDKISAANSLSSDNSVSQYEKVSRSIKSFKRISENEVFTTKEVAEKMIDKLFEEIDFTNFDTSPKRFIDFTSRSGIYLVVLFEKLLEKGISPKIAKNNLYAVATSPIAYEFTRKVFELMDFPIENLMDIEQISSFNLIESDTGLYNLSTIYQYFFKEDNNMKFDIVVGNPPYQETDGGSKASAKPVYNLFSEMAMKKMAAEKVCLITPSKWFAGGKGLDSFRNFMLNNGHIQVLSDYTNSKDVFSGVSIGGGVSYFVYNRNFTGDCTVINNYNGNSTSMERPLNEYSVFVRYNDAVSLLHKIIKKDSSFVSKFVSSRNPFGLPSNFRGSRSTYRGSILLLTSAGNNYIDRKSVTSGLDKIDEYKVVVSKVTSEHAGEPDKGGKFKIISSNRVMGPNSVCTDSYLVIFNSKNEEEAYNYLLYLKTKFYRCLLMLSVSSINLSSNKFKFIPNQDFSFSSDINWKKPISEIDKQLYEKYEFEEREIRFVENIIKEMI